MEVVSCQGDGRLGEVGDVPEVERSSRVPTGCAHGAPLGYRLLQRQKPRVPPSSPSCLPPGTQRLQLVGGRGGEGWGPGGPLPCPGPQRATICRHTSDPILCRPNSCPHRVFPKVCLSPRRHQRDSVHPADGDEAQQMLPEREGSHVTAPPWSWSWSGSRAPGRGPPGPGEGPLLGFVPFSPFLPAPPPSSCCPQQSVRSLCEKETCRFGVWRVACHGGSPSLVGRQLQRGT